MLHEIRVYHCTPGCVPKVLDRFENIVFDLSAFIQPALSSLSDYKATLIGQLDFHVNENFKISLQYNTLLDHYHL